MENISHTTLKYIRVPEVYLTARKGDQGHRILVRSMSIAMRDESEHFGWVIPDGLNLMFHECREEDTVRGRTCIRRSCCYDELRIPSNDAATLRFVTKDEAAIADVRWRF